MSQDTYAAWTIPALASKVSHLTKRTFPVPVPGPKQVLVKLTAASLNFRDFLIATRNPAYPGNHIPDLVPGADGAGIIASTGPSSIWSTKIGQNVILNPNNWISGDFRNLSFESILGGTGKNGTLQEFLVVDDNWIVEAPKSLSPAENASLITAGTTAWWAIRGWLDLGLDGEVRAWQGSWTEKRLAGKTLLTMGTGGVSCFAIQIASALGATVIATSSSKSKLDLARSLGATHLINYAETPHWDQEVLKLTAGKGVDHVIETGGAGTLMRSLASTRVGGLISLIGILTPNSPIPEEFVPAVLFGAKVVRGQCAFSRDSVAEFAEFVEANRLKPVVAKSFGFDDTIGAFEELEKQSAVGKIVIEIGK